MSLFEVMPASEVNIYFSFSSSYFFKLIKSVLPSDMLLSLVVFKNSRQRKVGKRKVAFVKFSLENMGVS